MAVISTRQAITGQITRSNRHFLRAQQAFRQRFFSRRTWVGLTLTLVLLSTSSPYTVNLANAAQPAQSVTPQPLVTSQQIQAVADQAASIRTAISELLQLTQDDHIQSTTNTLTRLHQLASDNTHGGLRSDAIIYGYAMALRQLEPVTVSPTVIAWLGQYHSHSWRQHAESATYRIPLYDVAAAIKGTQNEWQFQAGRTLAHALKTTTLEQAALVYQNASAAFQRGFDYQLREHTAPTAGAMFQALMQQPYWQQQAITGELAQLMMRAEDDTSGITAYQQWLQHAAPAQAIMVLRATTSTLNNAPEQRWAIYQLALKHRDDNVFAIAAALAVQDLHAATIDTTTKNQRLLQLRDTLQLWLEHPQRGAIAALQLAAFIDADTVAQWRAETTSTTVLQQLDLIASLQRNRLHQTEIAHD